jgi:hypothetical protein
LVCLACCYADQLQVGFSFDHHALTAAICLIQICASQCNCIICQQRCSPLEFLFVTVSIVWSLEHLLALTFILPSIGNRH